MKRRVIRKVGLGLLLALGLALYILRFSPISYDILRHSSQEGYYGIVTLQLHLGVKADGPARTALIESILNDRPAIAELLVDHGADIEQFWGSGEPNGPPLAWALACHCPEIAKMLLRHEANPKYKPHGGPNYALHIAVEMGDAELVRMLLERKCDPNSMPMGVAPLHVAAGYGDLGVARLLLQAGAMKNVRADGWSQPCGYPDEPRDRHRPDIAVGATPIDVAVARKDRAMVRLLSSR